LAPPISPFSSLPLEKSYLKKILPKKEKTIPQLRKHAPISNYARQQQLAFD